MEISSNLISLLKNLTYPLILEVCAKNKELQSLCNNDKFWEELYREKFPDFRPNVANVHWRKLFQVKDLTEKDLAKELKEETYLSKVIWAYGSDRVKLENDNEDVDLYLKSYKIPWKTDQNGNVTIILREDIWQMTEDGEVKELVFKPENYPTAYDLMNLLITSLDEDSGMSVEEYFYSLGEASQAFFRKPQNSSEFKQAERENKEKRLRLKQMIKEDGGVVKLKMLVLPYLSTPFFHGLTPIPKDEAEGEGQYWV